MRSKKGTADIYLKPVQLNPIQVILTVSAGVMLITTFVIISTISKSPAGMANGVNIVLQMLIISTILFACILLSRIENKLKRGK